MASHEFLHILGAHHIGAHELLELLLLWGLGVLRGGFLGLLVNSSAADHLVEFIVGAAGLLLELLLLGELLELLRVHDLSGGLEAAIDGATHG